jgi:2-oxoglutarate dehydrogenase E2 component (dihydrolipoamide succinyltransferase)
MNMSDIVVPTLGESVTEASVGQWLKKAGDSVKRDDVLVELETDKVSVEVSAQEDGVLTEIVAAAGETVEIGAVLGRIGAAGAKPAAAAAKAAPSKSEASKSEAAKSEAPKPETPAKAGGAAALVDVVVPQMGESVSEGAIGQWLKKVGDPVKADEAIVEIETDKVAVEVPAGVDGVVSEHLVKQGETVGIGALIARIRPGAAAASAAPAAAATPAAPSATASAPSGDAPVSPAVRRIAGETGLDVSAVPGSGKDGRVTKGDALAYLEKGPAAKPAASAAPVAAAPRSDDFREERVKMTRLRQTIARRLKEAQDTAAMLTTFNDVDLTEVMAVRTKYKDLFEKKHGVKLGFMSFFTKACVVALQDVPAVNAEIDGTDIIYKNYYDISIAVGTEKGLVTPVLRDADTLSLAGIEKGIGALGKLARDGKLALSDLQGGTFTITNGGVYGSLMSTPILNPPQSGVLGMHRIEQRPVVVNGQIVARPMMYLALSYDHQIVDGKEAVTFLVRVKECLEDPERMLLDL